MCRLPLNTLPLGMKQHTTLWRCLPWWRYLGVSWPCHVSTLPTMEASLASKSNLVSQVSYFNKRIIKRKLILKHFQLCQLMVICLSWTKRGNHCRLSMPHTVQILMESSVLFLVGWSTSHLHLLIIILFSRHCCSKWSRRIACKEEYPGCYGEQTLWDRNTER